MNTLFLAALLLAVLAAPDAGNFSEPRPASAPDTGKVPASRPDAGPDFELAVLVISGASELESLDESTLERFSALASHHLNLNTAGRSRLIASGLLSAFQAASLLDWRERTGPVLSYTELSLIDGFGKDYADALRHFTTLGGEIRSGGKEYLRFHQELTLNGQGRLEQELSGPASSASSFSSSAKTIAAFASDNGLKAATPAISNSASNAKATGSGNSATYSIAGGFRYHASLGERAEAYWSARSTLSGAKTFPGTMGAVLYGRPEGGDLLGLKLGKLIIGHFNARFGQGLSEWSGFSVSPYSSISSFIRNPTGFSATGSYSPGHLGAAVEVEAGKFTLGAALSATTRKPIASISFSTLKLTAGALWNGSAASVDFKLSLKGASLSGEISCPLGAEAENKYAGRPFADRLGYNLGFLAVPSYGHKVSVLIRGEGASPELLAGWGAPTLDAVAAASGKQQRILLKYKPSFTSGALNLAPSLRLAAKHGGALNADWTAPGALRLEARGELKATLGALAASARGDFVKCSGAAWLMNAELSYNPQFTRSELKSWFRWTLFRIDNWNDRIYVYERDVPGSFNVPAYYGRGFALSLVGCFTLRPPANASENRLRISHSLCFRFSYTSYPWTSGGKPSRGELHLQYRLKM